LVLHKLKVDSNIGEGEGTQSVNKLLNKP